CVGAGEIAGTTSVLFSNAAFTADAPPGTCNSGGATVMQNSAWYRVRLPHPGVVTLTGYFSILGSPEYDGIMQVYRGIGGIRTPVVCGDQPQPAVASFNAAANTTYFVQVGDWGTLPGGGATLLSVDVESKPGEVCTQAAPIECGQTVTFDNS